MGMLTAFGKAIRKYRIDKALVLRDMANELSVSAAYLSAIETGKKSATPELIEKIANYFELDEKDRQELKSLAFKSRHEYRLNVVATDTKTRELVASFARSFSNLNEKERVKVFGILNTAAKRVK